MNKRLFIAFILFILLSTYQFKENTILVSKINIQKIILENNSIIDKSVLKKKLSFLYNTNLFLLNTEDIEMKLNKLEFIESFEVKKIFPDTIKIKIFEKKPIFILQNKKEKKYYINNGSVINFIELEEFKNLPLVFGDQKNFKKFYDNLKEINYPLGEIKTYYLFETDRWDLITTKNQTIKLPISNYVESLKNFKKIKDEDSFNKYKIFDYRINNQLILK